jgi:tRNA-specific 2-thiouridylase
MGKILASSPAGAQKAAPANNTMKRSPDKITVAVAVSGGVDSLCSLLLLRDQGYRLLALHALLLPQASSAPANLAKACADLDVPLHVLDMRSAFRAHVLSPFAAAYARGETPNPCALCNRSIKWGSLLDAALELGADMLATGHYAGLQKSPLPEAPPLLASAADRSRDQSYFLALVPAERLRRALFPLAELQKHEVRSRVAEAGLPIPLPEESQDICFVQSTNRDASTGIRAYGSFLEAYWQKEELPQARSGPILLLDATGRKCRIGSHAGLWRYTEGQRKGLGIAHSEALFVLDKDVQNNALIVGPRELLGIDGCCTGPANINLPEAFWPDSLLIRLRHRQQPVPGTVCLHDGCLHITFPAPCFPGAPGQLAAVYDGAGRLLAAGIIEKQHKHSLQQL